ncbi:MAG: helix-turn-helix transcriptional regulator [Bacilli bacterium]
MFSTNLFGSYLSKLRKDADMTQSDLAIMLNVTRQAVSSYEVGDCFPDITILIEISKIFKVSVDDLINAGNATKKEAIILRKIIYNDEDFSNTDPMDIVNLAPLLKPSVLSKLTKSFNSHGIEIDNIVELARYLNDEAIISSLTKSNIDVLDTNLLYKLIPILNEDSRNAIFQKILDGEADWHLIKVLLNESYYVRELIEAAVVEGVLPWEALELQRQSLVDIFNKEQKRKIVS